ncbi:MAG: hypothetical protein WCQ52_08535, partial [Actinomycetes bacterium]
MAGERKGITYEAIVKVALEDYLKKNPRLGRIFWNEKPELMTIEPDFTIGKDKNNPNFVILVTHSGAKTKTNMKFWRNIGELVETKVRLPSPARVFSIVFDAAMYKDLKVLQGEAFDGQLIVSDTRTGPVLLQWVSKFHKTLPKEANEKVDLIKKLRKDPIHINLDNGIKALVLDLESLFKKKRPELDSLWSTERARKVGKAPSSQNTYLRRGAGKLLILDKHDQVDATGKLDSKVPIDLKLALQELGLAKNTLDGFKLIDSEMLWVLKHLPITERKLLHSAHSSPKVKEWVEALRALGGIQDQLSYLCDNWKTLTTGTGLFTHLKKCHADPHALCPSAVLKGSKRVWLFHLIIEWIKISKETRTSYGITTLLSELKERQSDIEHQKRVQATLGRKVVWQSEQTIRLGIQDWQSAGSVQKFPLIDDGLARIADVMAIHLAARIKPVPSKDDAEVRKAIIQTVLEAKLLTYINFQPLPQLIAAGLQRAGLK